ncbi:MAG: hypothetical protein DI552_00300 [Brevundimonas sp.]|uniref:hypothetical protein n=1 Tax=Brevundimonas sp. TaxID=1871086 RepID=UPI000DBC18E9|nr:hypothetical protein [Brevundimonas sp.]PZU62344.1 MAG: hypothetical protein DI552_00300 [Brevundimonas sp.]
MTDAAQPLDLAPQDPPEAWVIRARNGNVRMWTQVESLAKARAADWGLEARLEPITPRDLDPGHPIRRAVVDIVAERQYQISRHGWSRDHDDTHADGAIANAAADYASTGQQPISTSWAYGSKVVDKEPRRQQLVKAGALIIAEIERLDRQRAREMAAPSGDVITSAELIANTDSARGAIRVPGETDDRRIYGQPEPTPARKWVDEVATRDAAVAYRARIACDILEGFTDGIDGDRLGELARWTYKGRAFDQAALLRAFAAPWIAAQEEAGWIGDPDAQAQADYERHTVTARVHGATSYPPEALARIFAEHNRLELAAEAVSAIRPSNWNDGEDPDKQKAWTALDEALK